MTIGRNGTRFNPMWLLAATPFLFSSVQAQDSQGAQASDEPIEEIITTGSRIPRAGFDTLMPAIVIDAQFLEDRGFTDVATCLLYTSDAADEVVPVEMSGGGGS